MARELDLYGNAIAGDSSFIPFLYQGQYYDEEIGLAYNRFRYYSPDSGTYISQDPIGLAGGLAFYRYVMDCKGWIDPWGLSSAALRRNLEASYGDNKQAQHLIPEEVWNDTDNTKFFNDIGLGDGRDKKENGLMIWDNEKMATANNKKYYHGGSHADYSLQVGFEVRDINLRYNIHGDKDLARKEISELQNRLRTELDADLDDINTKAKKITLIFNFMDSNILKKLKELGKMPNEDLYNDTQEIINLARKYEELLESIERPISLKDGYFLLSILPTEKFYGNEEVISSLIESIEVREKKVSIEEYKSLVNSCTNPYVKDFLDYGVEWLEEHIS